uniref:Uncharacterized protein n=1 Tax=Salmo trutta TaxID=8032 RepID=A0A673Y8A8_SALTR
MKLQWSCPAHQHQNLIPIVRHVGGNIMDWGCFAVYQDNLTLCTLLAFSQPAS